MRRSQRDKAPWLLTGCIALTLGGVSALAPRQAAQAAPVALAGVTAPAAPAAEDDGDGDELLEHWNDVRYGREQRLQLGGLVLFFCGASALSLRRRAALRRSYRDG